MLRSRTDDDNNHHHHPPHDNDDACIVIMRFSVEGETGPGRLPFYFLAELGPLRLLLPAAASHLSALEGSRLLN